MSRQPARSWLTAAARCSRRLPHSPAGLTAVRRFLKPTGQEAPPESPADWQRLQVDRADFKTLVDTYGRHASSQTRDNTFQPHHTLHRPVQPTKTTLSALVAAGAHLGHSKSLMNPNFAPFAYGTRADITIIDLDHTLPLLRRAAKVVRGVAAKDGTIVFVGTRPDLRVVVRKAAARMGSQGFHVGERWLPGTLTNKLEMFGLDSVKSERIVPDLVVFLNPIPNVHAIRECAVEHIPTIGIVDSNVDPRIVMYPIPANDESTRTAELIAGVLSVAGREGVALAQEDAAKQKEKAALYKKMVARSSAQRSDPVVSHAATL